MTSHPLSAHIDASNELNTLSGGNHLYYHGANRLWRRGEPRIMFPIASDFPLQNGTANISPSTHSSSVARVFPFYMPHYLIVNAVIIKTALIVADVFQWAIFNASGTQVFSTGTQSSVNGWVTVTTGTPFTMTPGTYYGASTNANNAGVTSALTMSVAVGTASLPRYGTVAATSGAMPASIDPTAITETTGGWMNQVLLSGVTT